MSIFAKRTNNWTHANNALEDERLKGLYQGEVLDLTQSNPTQAGFVYPAHLLAALSNPHALVYDPQSFGLEETRQAVVDYYYRRGYMINRSQVVLTASSSESYGHLLRLLVNPHEKVLIPSPSYPLFPYLLDIHDAAYDTYQILSAENWAIDREDFLARLDASVKAVMLVHPNNPTGSYINEADRAWLIQLAKTHGFALIVDEVFMDYAFDKAEPSFINETACLTFVLGGLSKTLCLPQMKLGWLITSGPKELVDGALARLEIMADTYLSVNTPVQLAACQWLPGVDAIQDLVRQRLKHNWAMLEANTPKGLTIQRPQAGWYVLVHLPDHLDDEQFCLALMAKGVIVYPGYYFDLPSSNDVVISLLTESSILKQGWDKLCTMI